MEVARFAPRPISTKYLSCAVRGCGSKSHKDATICFHKFPRPGQCFVKVDDQKIDRFLVWKNLLEVDHVTPKTKVCSLHFLKSDYFFPDIQAQKRILKKIAVPSCNLPGVDVKRGNNESPGVSKKPNEEILFVNVKVENVDFESTPEFANFQSTDIKQEILEEPFFKDAEVQANESPKPSVKDVEMQAKLVSSQFPYEEFIRKTKNSGPEPPVKDAEVQVKTDCILFNVIHCIKSDQELHISTGIESFDALSAIVQRIKEICGEKFEHPNMRLNTRERVIMTFMKLKHNLSYSFLAILFKHYTPTHCKRVITETIDILSQCSKDGISWPLIKDIKKTLLKHS
ncbi:uncharacterized protein LOC107980515 [Nasonia vitripennis]|uniref:THAP-type domain-containing protein n=1 Tax=Nasonia vitripennis TaxID=7425 RepID=A0A7M7PWL1_NASVI|nr:uncharacterized protein LOC107980515 [Nasonia vitripennis]